jgi:hypothetical protein
MSIASRFKKDRLFQFHNPFNHEGNRYQESFYYLINSVEYTENKKISKVSITIIVGIENYLLLGNYDKIVLSFETNIPKHILLNIKGWEMLLD